MIFPGKELKRVEIPFRNFHTKVEVKTDSPLFFDYNWPPPIIREYRLEFSGKKDEEVGFNLHAVDLIRRKEHPAIENGPFHSFPH